jgi:hypothetical protein
MSLSRALLITLAGAFSGCALAALVFGLWPVPSFRMAAMAGTLTLVHAIPAAVLVGAPVMYVLSRIFTLGFVSLSLLGAFVGALCGVVATWQNVALALVVIGFLFGAVGGLVAAFVLTRSNYSIQSTREA